MEGVYKKIFKLSQDEIDRLVKEDKALSSLPIYALECGGTDLNKHIFEPKRIVIIGNEKFGVSRDLLDIASTILTISLYGSKGSINVSTATAILLQRWSSEIQ